MDRPMVMEQVEKWEARLGEVVVGDLEPYKDRSFRIFFSQSETISTYKPGPGNGAGPAAGGGALCDPAPAPEP